MLPSQQSSAAALTAAPAQAAPHQRPAAAQQLVERLRTTFSAWRHHWRSRRDLLALDDHLLKDIGLTRSQVDAEAHKPFWRV